MDHDQHSDPSGKAYTCPMHPEIVQDRPGMCPECGMNLVPTRINAERAQIHAEGDQRRSASHRRESANGYQSHSGNIFKRKFWVSFVLSIPVVLYSDIVRMLLDWQPPQFAGSGYVTLALASIIFFYGGWIFLSSAWREIRGRLPGMMTLISLAITAAYAWSVYVTL